MTTDYDQGHTAEQYQEAKDQPWRARVETYSFLKRIGDLRNKRVLDLACGEGHFTRLLRQAGASEVVGLDISERMVDLARAQEAEAPMGIEYRVEDARTIVPQQDFDVAAAAWLLVYAQNRQELAAMCQGLASRIRSGGRFVTVTVNPEVYFFTPSPDYRKYGLSMRLADHVYEGAPIVWTIHLKTGDLEIENYYLPVSAYASAFEEAGFRDFKVHPLELSPNPQGRDDSEYWAEFLNNPLAIVIDCVKT